MSRSSGADNAVWEEEQVTRMLDLAGDEDEADDANEDSDDAPRPARECAAPAPASASKAPDEQQGQDQDSERWSDITDPFEEFHRCGALQTEEALPAPAQQPPCSRRAQFLRAVSLFSPAHQLAVLEVRDEQGVSLLERSTSLTAEPLDPLDLDGVAPVARSLSLPAGKLVQQAPGLGVSRGLPTLRTLSSRSTRSSRSGSLGTEPSARGLTKATRAARPSDSSRRRSSAPGTRPRALAASSGRGGHGGRAAARTGPDAGGAGTAPRTPRSLSGSGTATTASDAADEGAAGHAGGRGGSGGTAALDVDPNADPTLAALLRSLWVDPPLADPKRSPRPDAGTTTTRPRDRDRDKDKDREPDVLSGLWRMLDCYDEFKCSPPGFHAFRQDKPHWLDQEPIPWAVREAAREKCNRWLRTCPGSPAAYARETRADSYSEGRRQSELDGRGPPPARSLTSTPALADHVPAITAVRKLKQFKSQRP